MSPAAERRRVEVVAALIAEGNRLLIQRRPPGRALPELWEFPGGKREAGETEAESLRRECREEIGVEVEVGERIWKTEHHYPELDVDLSLYRCRIASGQPQPMEGQTLRWVEKTSWRAIPSWPRTASSCRFWRAVSSHESRDPSNFRVGAYGLLIEDGRLLLTRTRTRLGAVWNLPGGALELGEGRWRPCSGSSSRRLDWRFDRWHWHTPVSATIARRPIQRTSSSSSTGSWNDSAASCDWKAMVTMWRPATSLKSTNCSPSD